MVSSKWIQCSHLNLTNLNADTTSRIEETLLKPTPDSSPFEAIFWFLSISPYSFRCWTILSTLVDTEIGIRSHFIESNIHLSIDLESLFEISKLGFRFSSLFLENTSFMSLTDFRDIEGINAGRNMHRKYLIDCIVSNMLTVLITYRSSRFLCIVCCCLILVGSDFIKMHFIQ